MKTNQHSLQSYSRISHSEKQIVLVYCKCLTEADRLHRKKLLWNHWSRLGYLNQTLRVEADISPASRRAAIAKFRFYTSRITMALSPTFYGA